MKVKTITRSSDVYLARKGDQPRLPRNLDPALHPFAKAREYTHALNSTKLERLFAQPFIAQLGNGHVDIVQSLAKDWRRLPTVASGSHDGVVKAWDLVSREEEFSVRAHEKIVSGLCFTVNGQLLSCSPDKLIKLWDLKSKDPVQTYIGTTGYNSIDHHRVDNIFATASSEINIWDEHRTQPIATMTWGADTINTVKFNQTETSLIASSGTDRTLILYDLRATSPITKLITDLKTNAISWNPMEAFNFAAGSEDHNVYIYDMRKLNRALNVLKDHVAPVLDVDFSPTGEELVTASWDRSIRLFKTREGRSRDVYHTKRMQLVNSVRYSMDAKYIVSGSSDGNVRLWRANASDRSTIRTAREQQKLDYEEHLKDKFKHMPEIRRIARRRHVPKAIKNTAERKREELEGLKRREDNLRKHSKPGSVPYTKERERHIVAQQK